jgi:hypothetical protein
VCLKSRKHCRIVFKLRNKSLVAFTELRAHGAKCPVCSGRLLAVKRLVSISPCPPRCR